MRRLRCIKLTVAAVFTSFVVIQVLSLLAWRWPDEAVGGAGLLRRPVGLGFHGQHQRFVDRGLQNFPARPLAMSVPSTTPRKDEDSALFEPDQAANGQQLSDSLLGQRDHGLPPEVAVAVAGDRGNGSSGDVSDESANVDIPFVLAAMQEANEGQLVRNEDKFGPIAVNTTIIAIQVHNRLNYLEQLVSSLGEARGIEKTLLIFSHDYWDADINALISCITFARTLQIFYPFTLQTHPGKFPGESPSDCPRDAKKEEVLDLQCQNREWPDLYGHYREAKFTQTKHHWWWKANRIFDGLRVTKYHEGLVLFLEEDHLVAPDFLHVLDLVNAACLNGDQTNCDILCLGTYLKNFNFQKSSKARAAAMARHRILGQPGGLPAFLHQSQPPQPWPAPAAGSAGRRSLLVWSPANLLSSMFGTFKKDEIRLWAGGPIFSKEQLDVSVADWHSSKHNMGMAFDKNTWRRIRGCADVFCTFDDYNWDWSLHHVSHKCLDQRLKVLLVKAPRVFHVGECGVHHKKAECRALAAKSVKKVRDILRQVGEYLFPKELTFSTMAPKRTKLPKGNGGWGDRRDQLLCNLMTGAELNESAVLTQVNLKANERERRGRRQKVVPRR